LAGFLEIYVPLSSVTMFQNMSSADRSLLEAGGLLLEPRDGAFIFQEGEPADSVYAVIGGDGHVRLGSVDRNSKALMVELSRAGDIFGEMGVLDGGPRSASAVAEGRVRLFKIRATAFQAAMGRSPELGLELCRLLTRRLRRTYELLQDAAFETLEIRLARQVLYLADREGRKTADGVRLGHRLRQGDLADLLGATTRSIITILNNWRTSGLVVYDTEKALLTVRDVETLRALVKAGQRA
jgi:CRP/FNR family transcriptional regulator, cyclic AMP receptor protein